jgi:Zn finger protein HypA/HybF involved in hydrogenase expression
MSIEAARVVVHKLKCDDCGEILFNRMYLTLEELAVEQTRFHFCAECKTKRQELKKETGCTLIEETYNE